MIKKLDVFEKLLVLSLLIMPYTLLRVGAVGAGELIIIILFLSEFIKRKFNFYLKDFPFTRFWFFFLIISLFGFSFNVLFLDHATGTLEGMVFDFSSYSIILLASYTAESFFNRKEVQINLVLRAVFLSSSIVLRNLYILSFYFSEIFGLRLRYYNYFAPLVSNLHQIAMFIIPLPFLGLLVLNTEKNVLNRIVFVIIILLLFKMGFETGSYKAYIGLIFGAIVYFFINLISFSRGKFKKPLIFFSISMIILLLLINFEFINNLIFITFSENDVSNGRSVIYVKALDVAFASPIIGLGTGAHIFIGDRFWDSHQTFLTVFLQTGMLGLFFFLNIFNKIFFKLFKTTELLAAFSSILVYMLFGDILRKLPIWLLLILFYHYKAFAKTKISNE